MKKSPALGESKLLARGLVANRGRMGRGEGGGSALTWCQALAGAATQCWEPSETSAGPLHPTPVPPYPLQSCLGPPGAWHLDVLIATAQGRGCARAGPCPQAAELRGAVPLLLSPLPPLLRAPVVHLALQPSSTQRHILSSQRGRGFWGQRQRGRDGVKFCGHIEGPVSLVSGRELQQGRYLAWRLGHSSSQAGVAYKIKSCPRHPIPCQCGQEKRNLKKPFSSEGRVPVASPPEECVRKFCTALVSLCKSSYTLEFSGFLRSQGFSLCPQDGLWQQRASPGAGSQLSKAVPDHDHGPWAQTAGARPAHRHTPSGASAQAPVSVGFQEDTHAHMHG
ncbi:uncharacterized protein LOC118007338 [Mirounga leonina]|uniref:uncharacterized protein LOC118007338 n=1 Tax=Mirounga leonina TaxID=9715 RepID=UPI00156C18BF|nr:uncharacterized protein LOC118007338 [Mirounga leonina]